MMITKKRHHPLVIVFHFWGYIKTFYIPAIVLFIIRYDSDAFIWKYGRYAFIIITILTGIGIVIRWLTVKYELKEQAFYLYKGMFNKEEQIVPFNRVQNINRHTTFFHRVLKRTSIQFETGMSGENATVSFKVVSLQEANQLEAIVESFSYEEQDEEALQIDEADEKTDERMPTHERIVHFTPTHRDTIRASFTSFSFLILIPRSEEHTS